MSPLEMRNYPHDILKVFTQKRALWVWYGTGRRIYDTSAIQLKDMTLIRIWPWGRANTRKHSLSIDEDNTFEA